MADNRPIVYFDDHQQRWVYRASSMGKSVRCLAMARQGYTPLAAPDYLAKAAEAGNRYEPIVKNRLRADGYRIGGEQTTVEVLVPDTNAIIRGHLDAGYMTIGDDYEERPHILEVKSMSDRRFRKWVKDGFDAYPGYAAQISVYMKGTDQPAFYAVINRDTEEMMLTGVPEPPIPFEELVDKVQQVEVFGESGTLPPCDTGTDYFCPYEYMCDRKELLFEEIESGTEVTLIRLAEDYSEAREMEKEIKQRKSDIYKEITEALGDRERVMAGTWRISYTDTERSSLDKKSLEEFLLTHGKSLDDFTTVRTSKRLNVK